MKFYTGVGSRETPDDILNVMSKTAYKLASLGWTLRSGGAKGADSAFEEGWWNHYKDTGQGSDLAEIYLPYDGFNYHRGDPAYPYNVLVEHKPTLITAGLIASTIHPNWDAVVNASSDFGFKAHSRNVFQVIGTDFSTPSKMLIAWTKLTKAGEPMGGTATAINLAKRYGVEVFNLNKPEDKERVLAFIGE